MNKHINSRFSVLARLGVASLMTAGLIAGGVAAPASAHSRSSIDYVALGDSYSAGLGAGNYYDDDPCFRSRLGYPKLLDKQRSIDLEKNKACSGATTFDVDRQARAIKGGTELVTITIGGNNVRYGEVVAACMTGDPAVCTNALNTALAYVLAPDDGLAEDLDDAYEEIRDESKKAHVVVLGYPLLFSPEFMAPGAIQTAAAQINAATMVLNSVIANVAKANKFQYIDVTQEFLGHGIGSPDPWIHAEGSAALHPTATGYKMGYLEALKSELNIHKLGKRHSGRH